VNGTKAAIAAAAVQTKTGRPARHPSRVRSLQLLTDAQAKHAASISQRKVMNSKRNGVSRSTSDHWNAVTSISTADASAEATRQDR
jgi:predicted TIM-barrel enzyme